MTAVTVVDDYSRVRAAVERLVDGVRADQWAAPTPCTEWDVRELVGHIAGGDAMVTALASGAARDMVEARELRARVGDTLGDDPAAAFRAASAAARDAFTRPGFLEASRPTPFGEQPGAFLVHMRINESLVHGWDLARATGQSPDVLPDDLAEAALAMWRQRLAGRPREGGPFGPEQPAPPGAAAIDRLAAFLGRPL